MSEALLVRRGGSGLDFRVIGAAAEPAVCREKDIWVATDQPVTGTVFSAEQPQGREGLLWVRTGSSSPVAFPADRRGTLYVYPESCYQYLNAAWTEKTAMSRLSGAWTAWRRYYFREGEGPSAAWRISTWGDDSVSGAVSTSRLSINSTYNVNGQRALSSVSQIDLSGVRRIKVELTANTGNWRMGVAPGRIVWNTALLCSTGDIPAQANVRKTVELDVSALSGPYYLGGNNGSDTTTSVTIYNIWGE